VRYKIVPEQVCLREKPKKHPKSAAPEFDVNTGRLHQHYEILKRQHYTITTKKENN
jgi:hypothetical protein